MKQLITAALAVLFLNTSHAQTSNKRLDSLAAFYSKTLDFNGTVLVTQKGKILLNNGYGYQDKSKNTLNTSRGIYQIGSITKQFTAEIVLILARDGKLSLSDKLSKFYPAYAPADSITLENMLTHTSGIFDYTRSEGWEATGLDKPQGNKEIFSMFWNKPLNFVPGSEFSYSNTNYFLLGLIIEQVTGKSYYENVRERIFGPLGMTYSGFDFTHLKDKNKTTGYYMVRNDSFLVSISVDSTQTNAAGSIYSTTGDMLKWYKALHSYQLLNKTWQDKAYIPFKNNYCYGWETDSLCGKHILSHSGHIHGYNSNFYMLPDEDVCVVVLTNLMKTGADPIVYAAAIVKAMYDPQYVVPAVREEVQIPENVIQRYEGVYVFAEDPSLQFTFRVKNKQLHLQLTGQAEVPLLPQSENLFFTKVVDAQVEFKEKQNGGYLMILHQDGQDIEAEKRK